jgi:hypothetical protein
MPSVECDAHMLLPIAAWTKKYFPSQSPKLQNTSLPFASFVGYIQRAIR